VTERVAIYPGSFDPPTNGHLDIVERSSRLFDRVVVGVGRNLAKKTVFSADERIELMREACAKYRNVEVTSFDGLQVDFAHASAARFIVRGIRALSDFEFEFEMANMNRTLAAGIEMVYLMTAAAFGAPIEKFVPPNVAKRLKSQMGKQGMRTGATEAND